MAHVPAIGKVWMYSRGSTGGKYPEGQWVLFNRVSGHRDAGYTSCPGDRLYALLGAIRKVAYGTGLPKIFLPRQSVRSVIYGQGQAIKWTATASDKLMWHIEVTDQSAHVVRASRIWGPSLSLTWDGTDAVGLPVPVGTYTVKIWGTKKSKTALPAELTLTVVPEPLPSPSPSPSPSESPSPSPSPSP